MSRSREFDSSQGTLLTTARKQQQLLAAAAAAAAASNGSKLHSMCEKRKSRAEGFNDLADDVIKARLWLGSQRYSIAEDNEQKRIPEGGVGTC
ncbi:hypothetical protein HZH68_008371 [Vespula germanica]|uniref:Uncharacterized protein n=1 Tax=Vespula germanica TaxID=30212 RepID=A0A834K7J3_VESGE|nr:hypothetical protein HZH68_008371 [Vespula germanica]